MTVKEKLKDFWFRFKIFGWYLCTEPIRQFKELIDLFLKMLEALNKTRTWVYVTIVAMIAALFFGKRVVAALCLVFLLICVLLLEWESGFFMNRYREKVKHKIEEDLKKDGEKTSLEAEKK